MSCCFRGGFPFILCMNQGLKSPNHPSNPPMRGYLTNCAHPGPRLHTRHLCGENLEEEVAKEEPGMLKPTTQTLPIDFGPSNGQVLRPQNPSGVFNGGSNIFHWKPQECLVTQNEGANQLPQRFWRVPQPSHNQVSFHSSCICQI